MENTPPNTEEIAQTAPALQSTRKQGSKQKNGSKLVSIICAVLAVAGIGFGIFEYIDSGNKSVKIAELSAKLDLIKMETNTELVTKNEDGVERTYVEPATTTETVTTKDYIYVGEWGIKIKIPETVKDVSYIYESFTGGSGAIYVNGHSSDDPTDYSEQAYDDSRSYFNPAGKAAISLHEVGEDRLGPTGDISGQKYGTDYGTVINIRDKQKVIDISGPQVSYWANIKDQVDSGRLILQNWDYEERIKWESAAATAIREMLSDPANYSAI